MKGRSVRLRSTGRVGDTVQRPPWSAPRGRLASGKRHLWPDVKAPHAEVPASVEFSPEHSLFESVLFALFCNLFSHRCYVGKSSWTCEVALTENPEEARSL